MTPLTDIGFTVTVLAGDRTPTALVYLAGEIDLAAVLGLDAAVDQVATAGRTHVVVDLAQVTFACSTLAHFLIRMHHTLDVCAALTVSRATPSVRRVLQATDMAAIATLTDDLPPASTFYSCGIERDGITEDPDIGARRRERAAVAYLATWMRELLAGRSRSDRPASTADRETGTDDAA